MKSSCSPRRLRGCQKPGEPLSASLILLTRSHSLPKVNLPHQHPVSSSLSLSFSLPLYLFLLQHLCTSREGKALIMHSSHLIPHSLPNLPHFPSVPRIPPHFTRTLHPSIFMIPNNLLPSLILLISSYVFHLKLFNTFKVKYLNMLMILNKQGGRSMIKLISQSQSSFYIPKLLDYL